MSQYIIIRLRITLQPTSCVAFRTFMGNSSLGSDGGSDARGRAYSRGCRLKDVGHQSKAFRQPSRPIPASGKHCYARHATCTLREATRILPHRPSFSSCLTWHQLDRSPTLIGCNHYANCAPSLSSFSVVCVFCHLSCRVATGGSVIWEKAQGANALIPPSVDGYVHILPNFLDPKRRCG